MFFCSIKILRNAVFDFVIFVIAPILDFMNFVIVYEILFFLCNSCYWISQCCFQLKTVHWVSLFIQILAAHFNKYIHTNHRIFHINPIKNISAFTHSHSFARTRRINTNTHIQLHKIVYGCVCVYNKINIHLTLTNIHIQLQIGDIYTESYNEIANILLQLNFVWLCRMYVKLIKSIQLLCK